MENLISKVRELTEAECHQAGEEFYAATRSTYEGYVLIKEQLGKAQRDAKELEIRLGCIWAEIKAGGTPGYVQFLEEIRFRAECAALELIHTAAIAEYIAEKRGGT